MASERFVAIQTVLQATSVDWPPEV